MTVICKTGQYSDYLDLTVFEKGGWNYREGDAINVVGEIRKRKPREGSRVWETQLVAKTFTAGDDKLAPRPKRSGEPQNDTHEAPPDDDVDF